MISCIMHRVPASARSAAVIGLSVIVLCAFASRVAGDVLTIPEEDAHAPVAAESGETDQASIGAEPAAGGSFLNTYAAGSSPLTGGTAPATGGVLLKLIMALVLVLALILLLQRAARKWGGSFQGGGGPEAIRIVSSRPVGPRMSLALVQVMNRTLLVGISPQGIRQVADLGAGAELAPGPASTAVQSRSRPAPVGIWDRLTGMLSRDKLAQPDAPAFAKGGGDLSTAFLHAASPDASCKGSTAHQTRGSDRGSEADPAEHPAGFEEELSRRLAELRRRYITLSDLEVGLEGGRS